jgi:hypothetical protein
MGSDLQCSRIVILAVVDLFAVHYIHRTEISLTMFNNAKKVKAVFDIATALRASKTVGLFKTNTDISEKRWLK